MNPALDHVPARVLPVQPMPFPLLTCNGGFDGEQHLVVAGRSVESFSRTYEPRSNPVERFPNLCRRQPILAREPILERDDDVNPPFLDILDCSPKLTLAPRLRA